MPNQPFWEQTYADTAVSTFTKEHTVYIKEF